MSALTHGVMVSAPPLSILCAGFFFCYFPACSSFLAQERLLIMLGVGCGKSRCMGWVDDAIYSGAWGRVDDVINPDVWDGWIL